MFEEEIIILLQTLFKQRDSLLQREHMQDLGKLFMLLPAF